MVQISIRSQRELRSLAQLSHHTRKAHKIKAPYRLRQLPPLKHSKSNLDALMGIEFNFLPGFTWDVCQDMATEQ